MRWVDWEYIRKNEEHYPGVYDSFSACGVDDFVGQKLTKWNDELIMHFYSTAHFYPDGRIVWMYEGTRYQSTVEEWANLINAPKENEDHFPGVYDSFKACGVDEYVAQKLTKWNDELIMQFYSTAHFYQMEGLSGCLKVRGTIQWLQNGKN